MKFRPAILVNDVRSQSPDKSRQQLGAVVKSLVAMEEAEERLEQLHSLPVQGRMARHLEGHAAELWVQVAQGLPSDAMKFALNASMETLATNHNLHVWGKKTMYPLFPASIEPAPCLEHLS